MNPLCMAQHNSKPGRFDGLLNQDDRSPAKFSYSDRSNMAWTLFGIIIIPSDVYYVLGSPTIGNITWFALIDSLIVFMIARSWIAPVRKIYFFDGHMKVIGRMAARDISYSEVKVTLRKDWPSPTLAFLVTGTKKPFVLHTIPKSKELKTDLFSWLKDQVRESVGPLPGKVHWF